MIKISFEAEPCVLNGIYTVDFKANFTDMHGPWPSSYGIPGRYICDSASDACLFIALTAIRTINNKITEDDLKKLLTKS